MRLLAVQDVEQEFGGVRALKDCSFEVKERSITALIGPNGAGKTTMFNAITGLVRPCRGRIILRGEPLLDLRTHEVFHAGIARTFQLLRVFPKLAAIENLMLAQPGRAEGMFDRIFRPRLVRDEEAGKRERAMEYLKLVGLDRHAATPAGDLSYGQQKLLDIARCLATEAELLLLDEPVAGVNPVLRTRIRKLLKRLKREGRTILIVEHDMNFVMDIADEVIVLDHGERIAAGPPKKIRRDKRVINAYLGE